MGCPTSCPERGAAPPREDPRVCRDEPDHVDLDHQGLHYCFRRDPGNGWTFRGAVTNGGPGWRVTENSFRTAFEVVREAMTMHLEQRGDIERSRVAMSSRTCPECSAIVQAPRGAATWDCGPEHVLSFEDGRIAYCSPGQPARIEQPDDGGDPATRGK